jgi:hypothetical protein
MQGLVNNLVNDIRNWSEMLVNEVEYNRYHPELARVNCNGRLYTRKCDSNYRAFVSKLNNNQAVDNLNNDENFGVTSSFYMGTADIGECVILMGTIGGVEEPELILTLPDDRSMKILHAMRALIALCAQDPYKGVDVKALRDIVNMIPYASYISQNDLFTWGSPLTDNKKAWRTRSARRRRVPSELLSESDKGVRKEAHRLGKTDSTLENSQKELQSYIKNAYKPQQFSQAHKAWGEVLINPRASFVPFMTVKNPNEVSKHDW